MAKNKMKKIQLLQDLGFSNEFLKQLDDYEDSEDVADISSSLISSKLLELVIGSSTPIDERFRMFFDSSSIVS